jgi:signal transduction histidine kinase
MDSINEAVLDVARVVLEKLDVELVLKRVLDAARELTDARYAALGILDADRTQLGRFLTNGIDEPTSRRIGPFPTGRGLLGELIRNPQPLRLADVGSHPYSYGFPVGHPPMSSFLGVPILVDGQPYGNLYLTEKRSAPEFTDDDERAVVLLAGFAGVAIDHARQFSRSEAQRVQLQRTVRALDATTQIARALGGETDLAAILELVAKRARALVSARLVIVELLDGSELELAAGAGELPDGILGQRVPLAKTVASVALKTGRSQRLTESGNRVAFEQEGGGQFGMTAQDGLFVPLVFRERGHGVLVAVDCLEPGGFTAEHQHLLESFAVSAATAVAAARSAADDRRQQRLAAAETERARWARELHDETLQALGNIRLVLSSAARSGSAEQMSDGIRQALEQLEVDITGLRALITELRPAALDQLGLEPALEALLDRVRRSGLEVDGEIELAYEMGVNDERLDGDLETGIYRIVQEALTNAVRHGSAHHAEVQVREQDGNVQVSVRDDGVGFDPSAGADGFGLIGMRERSDLLAGQLTVESEAGHGTTITAVFPAKRRSSETGGLASDRVSS